MGWTADQEKAIGIKDKNLLVSAAAGSGKTAVLIERILERLTREESPASVTDFLIVTFTRAAAAELREKLYKGIMKRLGGPLSREMESHLRKQLVLLSKADVSTIDSFCQRVVRDHIHLTDLDPSFRIGDDAEMKLLADDTMAALMEAEYEADDEAIHLLTDYFSGSKLENAIEPAVRSLYGYSRNAPDPEAWLTHTLAPYRIVDRASFDSAEWNRAYLAHVYDEIRRLQKPLDEADRSINGPGGHYPYHEWLEALRRMVDAFRPGMTYQDLHDVFFAYSETLAFNSSALTRRKSDADPGEKEKAKALLNSVKNALKSYAEFFREDTDGILREFAEMRPVAEALVALTRKYDCALTAAKKEKALCDFCDIEHEALRVLVHDGVETDVAKALSERYEEILIDEYQDSSGMQEALLNAVATKRNGVSVNMFTVGDMKQSIYRFRMADPQLFVGKYDTFPDASGDELTGKVELRENFRSRKCVTDGINYIFRRIMKKEIGDVEYNDDAELRPGRMFAETERPVGGPVTIMLSANKNSADDAPDADGDENAAVSSVEMQFGADASEDNGGQDPKEDPEFATAELEAHMIAEEIVRLMDPKTGLYVEDRIGEETVVRPIRYKDIVILLRSTKAAEKLYPEIFEKYRIPCYIARKQGFYDTFEVQFVLNVLTLVDNPLNDIALAAVLHAPVNQISSTDLAKIVAETRGETDGKGLYGAVKRYISLHDDELSQNLQTVLALIEEFRTIAPEIPLQRLIRLVIRKTGLETFISALAGSVQRQANLAMLIEEGARFETTVYRGVYNFLRYVERKKEIDETGEVNVAGQNADLVRILTIHASKGLQYPVVFTSNLGRRFSTASEEGTLLFHQKMGIGLKVFRPAFRTIRDSYYFKAVRKTIHDDDRGEEIRDLYVAMTRAEEKLYLTAGFSDIGPALKRYRDGWEHGDGAMEPASIAGASQYIDLILGSYTKKSPIEMRDIYRPCSVSASSGDDADGERKETRLKDALRPLPDPKVASELDTILSFPYRYDDSSEIRSTLSVSLLKQLESEDPLEETETQALVNDKRYESGEEIDSSTDRERAVSALKRRSGIRGAERGTLYHRVMERIDPLVSASEGVASLRNNGLLSDTENDTIQVDLIDRFFASPIGRRFRAAYAEGKAHRETPFIISVPVREVGIYQDAVLRDQSERVMLQGVIDMWFEENDGLVLVDYKTDHCSSEEELRNAYATQLRYYEKALTMMTGKPVRERWIYSFALGKEIPI